MSTRQAKSSSKASRVHRDKKGWLYRLPREYATGATDLGSQHYDYENYNVACILPDGYALIKTLGRGKFSTVFLGIHEATRVGVVIKILRPISFLKIQREAKVLNLLRGGPGIVVLQDIVFDANSDLTSIVFLYHNGEDMRTRLNKYDDEYFRYLMLKLLIALNYAHSHGIMHRDVKTLNIVVNAKGDLRLIDWGMAEFYLPGSPNTAAVATRSYKAPELLVNYPYYHFAVDLWGVGCILAAYYSPNRRKPFFDASDNKEQLIQVCAKLGRKKFETFVENIGLLQNPYLVTDNAHILAILNSTTAGAKSAHLLNHEIREQTPIFDWEVQKPGRHRENNLQDVYFAETITEDALDLLSHLLEYDPNDRYTCREAINHSYFDCVRKKVETQYAKEGYVFDNRSCVIAIDPTVHNGQQMVRLPPDV